jgi:hypothetical protein
VAIAGDDEIRPLLGGINIGCRRDPSVNTIIWSTPGLCITDDDGNPSSLTAGHVVGDEAA